MCHHLVFKEDGDSIIQYDCLGFDVVEQSVHIRKSILSLCIFHKNVLYPCTFISFTQDALRNSLKNLTVESVICHKRILYRTPGNRITVSTLNSGCGPCQGGCDCPVRVKICRVHDLTREIQFEIGQCCRFQRVSPFSEKFESCVTKLPWDFHNLCSCDM